MAWARRTRRLAGPPMVAKPCWPGSLAARRSSRSSGQDLGGYSTFGTWLAFDARPPKCGYAQAERSRNHAATSGPTQAAVLISVLAGVAGIISTIFALLDYLFPRS